MLALHAEFVFKKVILSFLSGPWFSNSVGFLKSYERVTKDFYFFYPVLGPFFCSLQGCVYFIHHFQMEGTRGFINPLFFFLRASNGFVSSILFRNHSPGHLERIVFD